MKKDYAAIWAVLASALAIIIIISFSDGVNLGFYKLKSSGFVEALVEQPDTLVTEPITAAVTVNASTSAVPDDDDAPAPLDTAQQVILFAGDSMTEGLYPRLAAWCEASGHTLYAVIWYSSTTERWANSHLLKRYVDRLKPTFIFFSLGGNELFIRDIAKHRTGFTRTIVSEMAGRPYVWIGPPNWKRDTGINVMIAANTGAGEFFLTAGMMFDRKKDGAHPTSESATMWMDSIIRWIPLHAAHPIRMIKPEKTSGRAAQVFIHQPGDEP